MIPGVAVVHPRAAWVDPAYPVTGPPSVASMIDTAVLHYTAASKIPADIAGYHRSMQRSYVDNRGYSLGYRWSVTQAGDVYQIRGWDFKSAANAGHNDHTEPILMLVDGADGASPAAVASVKAIIAESQRRSGRTFAIVGHGQLAGAATACPGVGLRAQITAGVFTPTPTPPPTTDGDTDMIALKYDRGGGAWTGLMYTGTHLAHVTTSDGWSVPTSVGVPVVAVNDAQLDSLIRSSATTTACPPEWVGTPREAAWNAQRA